jgi:hypothetical protein
VGVYFNYNIALKNIDLDFISTSLISYIKLNTLSHTLNSYTALAALSFKYNINLTPDLFQNPNSPIIPDVRSHNRNSAIIATDSSLVNRYTIVSAIASDVLLYTLTFIISEPNNSCEPELQGIEISIKMLFYIKYIYIFTDSHQSH